MLRWLRALVRALGLSKENEQVADRFSNNERVALQEIRSDEGFWAITQETANSPTHSWTDSPGGNYNNNTNLFQLYSNR